MLSNAFFGKCIFHRQHLLVTEQQVALDMTYTVPFEELQIT